MVDFTTRKRHFGVVGYFGAFSEPLERKKTKPNVPIATLKKKSARMRGIFFKEKRDFVFEVELENWYRKC